jgi:hypothetical protein
MYILKMLLEEAYCKVMIAEQWNPKDLNTPLGYAISVSGSIKPKKRRCLD